MPVLLTCANHPATEMEQHPVFWYERYSGKTIRNHATILICPICGPPPLLGPGPMLPCKPSVPLQPILSR